MTRREYETLRAATRARIKKIRDRCFMLYISGSCMTVEEARDTAAELREIDAVCEKNGFPRMPKRLAEELESDPDWSHWTKPRVGPEICGH